MIAGLLESEWWNYKFTDFDGLDVSDPARFLHDFTRRKPDLDIYAPKPVVLAELAETWR